MARRVGPFVQMVAVLSLVLGLGIPREGAAQTVKLTTLEWPPYTGESLPSRGAGAAVVEAAFKAAGYSVTLAFFPWARAVTLAQGKNADFAGYFPEYAADAIKASFLFSQKIGESPLGFVERKSAPVAWETLDDLKGKTIGTVQGYVNTEAFDRMAAAGQLRVEEVSDDLTNVRKVLAGRIPLALIDKNVLAYLLASVPEVATARDQLQFNKKILENKALFVCFRRGPEGEKIAGIFREGMGRIDAERIFSTSLEAIMRYK